MADRASASYMLPAQGSDGGPGGAAPQRRRRFRLGFRARVLGSFVALVAGATFGGLLVQRAVLLARLDREVDDTIAQERQELANLAEPEGVNPDTGQPFGADVEAIFETFLARNVTVEGEVFLTFVDGEPRNSTVAPAQLFEDQAFVDEVATLDVATWGRWSTSAGPVRYLAIPLQFDGETRGVFVVANFLQAERDEIESSIRVAAVVAAGILLVSATVAWFVAGRLLRPVRDLTLAAEAIDYRDLERRIPVEGDDEIARLARQFNGMLGRLSAAFATERSFVDDAGHELRTPITIVRGHLELMGEDPQERRETIGLVTDELERMSRIVEDLLVLAKAEQPDFVQPERVEVAEFTTDLAVKARALGERTWTLDACATGDMFVDRQRLTQAMLNLVRNAHEHTSPGAEVGIGSERTATEIRFWVRDNGPGIDPAEQDRIFHRFARGAGGRRRSEGAGLGLAIVRSVVEAHGGRVELTSRLGEGSTFTVIIPFAAAWPPPEPAERTSQEVPA